MEIVERASNGVVIIEMKITEHSHIRYDEFHALIPARIDSGSKYFVVNLTGCNWIDSAGVGELVRSLVHVMRVGGNLKLAGAPHRVKGILAITNLTKVFEMYETEEEALASFPS